ncbi:hypothetical protein GC163_17740 [bacterium]|nr:hypothetical protein [bacterium]
MADRWQFDPLVQRVAWGLAVLMLSGCQVLDLTQHDAQPTDALASDAANTEAPASTSLKPAVDSTAVNDTTGTPLPPIADAHLLEQFRDVLSRGEWQVDLNWSVLTGVESCPSLPWRWRYVFPSQQKLTPNQSEVVRRYAWLWEGHQSGSEDEQELIAAVLQQLQTEPAPLGTSACILLAHVTPGSTHVTTAQLEATARQPAAGNTSLAVKTQCAAAEAWCRVLMAQSAVPPEEALAAPGRLLTELSLPEELITTLWRTLASDIIPDQLPGLSETLRDLPETTLLTSKQLGALEACTIGAAAIRFRHDDATVAVYREQDWPPRLIAWRLADDAQARQLVGRWAAWVQHPSAFSLLLSQRRDAQVSVCHSAIVSLGLLDRDESWQELRNVAQTGTDPERALAILALSQQGASELEPYVASERSTLRQAVATALIHHPNGTAAAMLNRLLADTDLDVQAAAVATAVQYPPALARPLLLHAIEEGAFATRKIAQKGLVHLDPEVPVFPIDGDDVARRQAVEEYARSRGIPLDPWISEMRASTVSLVAPETLSGTDERLASLVTAYLTAGPGSPVFSALQAELWRIAQPADAILLENVIRDQQTIAARRIQSELLPRLSSSYAAVRDLSQADVLRRRAAAQQLQRAAQQHPLSPDLVRLLIEPLAREQDQLVWQSCLGAVQADGHAAAKELATLALHHSWPDVRRLGLEYFQQHPDVDITAAVLPLLREANPRLQALAADVLGRCGNPQAISGFPATASGPATGGLRDLLTAPHPEVQWATLTALARLRDDTGYAELLRRLQSDETAIRIDTIRAMAASQQPRFIEPLIQLAWTDSTTNVKQTVLVALDQLVAVDDRPAAFSRGLAATQSIDDNVRIWVEWWEARTQRSISAAAVKGVEGVENR